MLFIEVYSKIMPNIFVLVFVFLKWLMLIIPVITVHLFDQYSQTSIPRGPVISSFLSKSCCPEFFAHFKVLGFILEVECEILGLEVHIKTRWQHVGHMSTTDIDMTIQTSYQNVLPTSQTGALLILKGKTTTKTPIIKSYQSSAKKFFLQSMCPGQNVPYHRCYWLTPSNSDVSLL